MKKIIMKMKNMMKTQNARDDNDEFWRRYDKFYPYGYNWEQKDNPCNKSYYNKDRWATRNIIASNIGLTAKMGGNNSIAMQFQIS